MVTSVRKQRSLNQIKEDISIRLLREKLPQEWVIHSYGSDHGIDCVIELFDFIDEKKKIVETLGENFFVQLKASDCIKYTKRRAFSRGNVAKGGLTQNKNEYIDIPVANFQLDMSDIATVQSIGTAIPILLILVDTKLEKIYFICLNDYIDKIIVPEDSKYIDKKSKVISIPIQNEIQNIEESLVPLRAYGKRSKMYGAFNLFNYQLKEIHRLQGRTNFTSEVSFEHGIDMIRTFTEIALRQDIWTSHEFWKPIESSFKELSNLRDEIKNGIKEENYQCFLSYCSEYIWLRLSNLANMYEELVREWFMPTYFAQITSYPKL